MATKDDIGGERRRQKPFDHLIHLILSVTVGVVGGDGVGEELILSSDIYFTEH